MRPRRGLPRRRGSGPVRRLDRLDQHRGSSSLRGRSPARALPSSDVGNTRRSAGIGALQISARGLGTAADASYIAEHRDRRRGATMRFSRFAPIFAGLLVASACAPAPGGGPAGLTTPYKFAWVSNITGPAGVI